MAKKRKNYRYEPQDGDLYKGVVGLALMILIGYIGYLVYIKTGFNFMGPR